MVFRWKHKIFDLPKFYLFIAGIFCLKLILMGCFSSDYQNQLFMKFINSFLQQMKEGTLINPYEYFKQEPALFPYPPMMLLIEALGGGINSFVWKNSLLKQLAV